MKRYILLFNNGHLVQQDGINETYMAMFDMDVLKSIIDTKEGKVIRGDKWEWKIIQSFQSPDLIINKPTFKKRNEDYTDKPRLKNETDLYYGGAGCTWGTDLDGKRYWKRYDRIITGAGYGHLTSEDIIDEKARIEKILFEYLNPRK